MVESGPIHVHHPGGNFRFPIMSTEEETPGLFNITSKDDRVLLKLYEDG